MLPTLTASHRPRVWCSFKQKTIRRRCDTEEYQGLCLLLPSWQCHVFARGKNVQSLTTTFCLVFCKRRFVFCIRTCASCFVSMCRWPSWCSLSPPCPDRPPALPTDHNAALGCSIPSRGDVVPRTDVRRRDASQCRSLGCPESLQADSRLLLWSTLGLLQQGSGHAFCPHHAHGP